MVVAFPSPCSFLLIGTNGWGKTRSGQGLHCASHLDFEDAELQKHCLETINMSCGSNKVTQMSVLKSLEGRDSQY